MDDDKPPFPNRDISALAPHPTPAAACAAPAEPAKPGGCITPRRPRDRDPPDSAPAAAAHQHAVVVYCDSNEAVSRGFLVALAAMGIADVEQLPERGDQMPRGHGRNHGPAV
jgi:hypothetical protein